MAIEDAACLTVLLEPGLNPAEIPSRMKLYEEIRYDRANKILDYTRAAGKDRSQADPQAFGEITPLSHTYRTASCATPTCKGSIYLTSAASLTCDPQTQAPTNSNT